MATTHGKKGTVHVSSNAVAEIDDWEVEETAEFAEDHNLNDDNKTRNTESIDDWSGSMNCHWDDTDSTGQEALTIGAEVTLNLYPAGDNSGKNKGSGTALITRVGVAVRKGAIVSRSFDFVGNGALTWSSI